MGEHTVPRRSLEPLQVQAIAHLEGIQQAINVPYQFSFSKAVLLLLALSAAQALCGACMLICLHFFVSVCVSDCVCACVCVWHKKLL